MEIDNVQNTVFHITQTIKYVGILYAGLPDGAHSSSPTSSDALSCFDSMYA